MAKLTYNKDEIVTSIVADSGFPAGMVRAVVDMVFIKIQYALADGIRVQINGFGSFEAKKRAPRVGRNPHTGEAVPIPPRVVPVFKVSPVLREFVGKVVK